jgi:imidazolonepropionase-like amidohydrolase
MKRSSSHVLLALFAIGGALNLAAQGLVITNARILTGDSNGSMIAQGSVVVRDGRIVSVSPGTASAPGARIIDAQGMTVMPGFIDTHRHLIQGNPAQWMRDLAVPRMQEFLEAGFTTVFSAIDPLDSILELRKKTASGEIKGPRILAAGFVPLARPTGPAAGGGGVDPARTDVSRPPDRPTTAAPAIPDSETLATVRNLAKAGVDAYKMVMIVTPGGPETATLKVIVEEAKKLGLPTVTHAVSVIDALAAVEAGTTALAHTPHIGQLSEAEARKIGQAGIPMMSTLGVFVPVFAEDNVRARARTGEDNIPRFRDLDPFPMNTLSSAGQGPVNARLLWDAGITYGYGTDTIYLPKDSLAQELRALRLVFSRKDILKIMTIHAANTLGRGKEIGSLEAGKLADIVLIDGNPLQESQDLLKVRVVIKGGEVLVDKR